MSRAKKVSNERSEAIELIKYMDAIVKQNTWQIKSIGGEESLNTGDSVMFPDIYIYGDNARTQVLQGWEVKMPNVKITNSAFIIDAQRKADVLRVNSCMLWNFSYGVLYIKNDSGWYKAREWNETSHIKSRPDVTLYRADWESVISDMLNVLNNFFVSGELHPAKIGEIVTDTVFMELIRRNKNIISEKLSEESASKTVIDAYLSQWWRGVEKEYKFDEPDKYSAYAKYILLNWINKFTFANLIKGKRNPAAIVETIDEDITPAEALEIFSEITRECDFYNIFETVKYSDLLPTATWADLTDYNAFLRDNGLSDIPQEALQTVLEGSINQFMRSMSGVFATPQKLASILVKAGINDLTAPTLDPCCGTGTIAKEILAAKQTKLSISAAYTTTYASDKFSLPLQISNIAMTSAAAINQPSLLFNSNAFQLYEGKEIEITDPATGKNIVHVLPKFGSIISNLPFVAFDQEGRDDSEYITEVLKTVHNDTGITLSGRTDLYQTILLYLHRLLADNASVAVITSNSWLGTIAGQEFFNALNYYYDVESIIASGKGKWFDNADVVTLMLFLKKKSATDTAVPEHIINFGLLNKPLQELSDDDINKVAESIMLMKTYFPGLLTYEHYPISRITKLMSMNIALNSFFYDINWLIDIKDILCPVTDLFNVFRGMKTGQDEIYYLKNPDDVDSEYMGRVFKSAKSAEYLITEPDTDSFVCDTSIDDLIARGHKKTLAWIERFRGSVNQSVPNKDSFWNNLSNDSLSGSEKIRLFTGMNPERRIFYGLLSEPAQINQRAIGFSPLTDSVNVELCHILLNSVIGIFYAEATGFPKGLGALDNRAENTKRIFMLDPRLLSEEQTKRIKNAFKPLLARKIMTTQQEYLQTDRLEFEHVVADCFGYTSLFERIKDCAIKMQRVRLSVRETSSAEN